MAASRIKKKVLRIAIHVICGTFVLAIALTIAFFTLVPRFGRQYERASGTTAKSHIATLTTALDAFEVDCGRYPATAEGFAPLFACPVDVKGWRGPYLAERWPSQDPWGHPYCYLRPGIHNKSGYDLYSAGPDGKFETSDDIDNWSMD